MLKMQGLPKAHELVLASTDTTPEWTVTLMIQLVEEIKDPDTRCLILGQYAGQAGTTHLDNIAFYASNLAPQRTAMSRTFTTLCDEEDKSFQNTDLILILDCCFRGTATRGTDSRDRSVEIIALVIYDESALGSPSDDARIQNRTFTSGLVDEVSRRIGREKITSISFAEAVDEIRHTSQPEQTSPIWSRSLPSWN